MYKHERLGFASKASAAWEIIPKNYGVVEA